jgi:cell volume regulation protein A
VDNVEVAMIAASGLVLIAAVASKVAGRLGIPALLLFLSIGMFAGSDGAGGIQFADYELARTLGTVALCFILFAGGLSTEWRHIRPVLREGLLLATFGVAVTAGIVGVVAAWILDESLLYGLLVGGIISSTDAAAVFSVLRARALGLKDSMSDLLELESGINDPAAVILTVTLVTMLGDHHESGWMLMLEVLREVGVGLLFGMTIARVTVKAINKFGLDYEGLYPVVSLAVVVLTYGLTGLSGGSGFLAVYIAGLVMGNSDFTRRRSMTKFHDGIAWLSQISMFLMLGLLVFPSQLIDVAPEALAVTFALVFIARPAAVFLCLAFSKHSFRYKAVLSWIGLRGAVPIILATFPLVDGTRGANVIFNVVFFTTLVSVLLQGTTVSWVARRLGIASDEPTDERRPDTVWTREGLHEVIIHEGSAAAGKRIVELGVPRDALFVLVSREDEHELPHGATVLHPGDKALLLGEPDSVASLREKLMNPHSSDKDESKQDLRN